MFLYIDINLLSLLGVPEDEVDLEEDEDEEEEEFPKQKITQLEKPKQEPKKKEAANKKNNGNKEEATNNKKRKREVSMDEVEVPDKIPVANPAYDKHGLFKQQDTTKKTTTQQQQPNQKKLKMEEELSNRQKRAIEEHFDVVPVQREFSESR